MSIDAWFAATAVDSLWWAFGLFFTAALVEMIFPPFPGDAVYFLGLVSIAARSDSAVAPIIASFLGGLVGFTALYWLGRIQGRRLFLRKPTGLLSEQTLHKMEHWLTRWGGWVIIFGRFLAGVRSAVPLVAGVGLYPRTQAIALGAISIVIWNGLLAAGALELGQNWGSVSRIVKAYNTLFWTAAIVIAILWGARFFWRRRKTRQTG